MKFTRADCGCYADGGFGHGHVRDVLSDLVRPLSVKLAAELLEKPSDDMSEELDALDLLSNKACEEDVYFTFDAGDLLLVDEDWIA